MGEPTLRFITYLSPSLPISYFEGITWYLGRVLQRETSLLYESRWSGPPCDRPDPFTLDEVDVGFICSGAFVKQLKSGQDCHIDLIPCAAIHSHPLVKDKPYYYADVVIPNRLKERIKSLEDLRGCTWAYNDPESLSGNLAMLNKLKQMGENASFFGHIIQSGSHLKSLELLINNGADAASVDSNAMSAYLSQHPTQAPKLHVVTSFGPLPIYPIVANKRLSEKLKKQICGALLNMHLDAEGAAHLAAYRVEKFVPSSIELYDSELQMREDAKGLTIEQVYY